MTEKEVLVWIKRQLGPIIKSAIEDSKTDFTEDLLAAITWKEGGIIIANNANKMSLKDICSIARGDYGKRKDDKEAIYHGYSLQQIDIASFPDFVKSGKWKDPYLSLRKSIQILEDKRDYIKSHTIGLSDADLLRATIASYNCGQGNIVKVINSNKDMDPLTNGKDYSQKVLKAIELYKTL